jgi:hypothetical protein
MSMARLELSDMIIGLREELEQAMERAAQAKLKFNVESIDIEAQVVTSKEADATGKLKWKFWVFSEAKGSVGAKVAKESVQTIRLKLTPMASIEIIEKTRKPVR